MAFVACSSESDLAAPTPTTESPSPQEELLGHDEDPTTTTIAPTTTTTEVVEVLETTPHTHGTIARASTPHSHDAAAPYESPRAAGERPATSGGGTPPDYVRQCESGGDYGAVNPNGHYGAWQFSQSTWESVGGTGRPDQASPAEQDRRAAILWDGGNGASHWQCA